MCSACAMLSTLHFFWRDKTSVMSGKTKFLVVFILTSSNRLLIFFQCSLKRIYWCGGYNKLLSKSTSVPMTWSDVLFCCSTSQWQLIEEDMGHRGGDVWSHTVWLLCRLHRRAHQGLPVWCMFTSRQGTRSALPCSTHRFVTYTLWLLLLQFSLPPHLIFCLLQ